MGRRRAWLLAAGLAGAALLSLPGSRTSLRAPQPVLQDDGEWVPELPSSVLEVPVVYDLTPVVDKLESVVPKRYGSLEERLPLDDHDGASVAFELTRSPLEARLTGTRAHVGALIHYRGRAWYDPPLLPEVSASCGTGENEAPPRVWIALSASLSLTEDWTLSARPTVEDVRGATDLDRDRCRITPLRIDVTDRVLAAAEGLITDSLPAIARELADIDVRSKFERWWRTLSEPIELGDDFWLVMDPRAVRRGLITGDSLTLVATVALVARPHIVMGPRPAGTDRPLPPLDSAEVDGGLTVRAIARGDYRVGSRKLTEELAGVELEDAGRLLRIRSISVSGIGGGRVALAVDLEGAVRGRVFLVGRPVFDPESMEVRVPDLEFDVATRDLLVGSLEWLAKPALVEILRARGRWQVDDLVDFARDQLDRGLNHRLGDDAWLRGGVDDVAILGVYATRANLFVHVAARAHATLLVDEP
ncbi:MAG: DUF4403 family protein [Gemmatimonadota bacterium]